MYSCYRFSGPLFCILLHSFCIVSNFALLQPVPGYLLILFFVQILLQRYIALCIMIACIYFCFCCFTIQCVLCSSFYICSRLSTSPHHFIIILYAIIWIKMCIISKRTILVLLQKITIQKLKKRHFNNPEITLR